MNKKHTRTITFSITVDVPISEHFAEIAMFIDDVENHFDVNIENLCFEYKYDTKILFLDITYVTEDSVECDEIAEAITNAISEYSIDIGNKYLEIHEKIYD